MVFENGIIGIKNDEVLEIYQVDKSFYEYLKDNYYGNVETASLFLPDKVTNIEIHMPCESCENPGYEKKLQKLLIIQELQKY